MTHEELLRLQGISLTMARAFSDFCQRHGLSCYLCGGGCIGAARDGHMIAWDDDLDFFMPRDDYERAWQIWEQEMAGGRYALERPGEQLVTHVQFAKIRDRETTYVLGYQRDVSTVHGVALDVLPLDGYPKGRLQRLSQVFWAYVYSLYCAQLVPQNHGPFVRGVARLLLAVVPSARLRHRIWRHAERRMTRWPIAECDGITELCSGPHYLRNYYPRDIFARAVMLPIENTELPVPVGYDRYLRIAFGDWEQLPPPEQRKPQHEAVFMDLDRSYTHYQGVECA